MNPGLQQEEAHLKLLDMVKCVEPVLRKNAALADAERSLPKAAMWQRRLKKATFLGAFLSVTMYVAGQQQHFDGKTWWHHVEVLAADNMEGRDTGSPGLQRAEAYVVDQLQESGLVPAGTAGYYQRIRFVKREIVEKDSSAALVRNGKAEPLALGEDAFFTTLVDPAPKVEAPLVFLGYGLQVPEKNYDDFAGLNLKGKVAVTFVGLPDGIEGPLAAHYLDVPRRWKQFREAGLIGWIVLPAPTGNWLSFLAQARIPTTHLADDAFNNTKGQQIMMWFNPAHADKLFDGTGHTPSELFALVKDRKPLPRFALSVSIRATTRMLKKPLESANVIAKLEGSDPKLKKQYVVLSAHIDAHGIREGRIYPGALDNASGCAALLDIAAELKKEGVRPRRSVLFVFFTGEERQLLGSKFFTAHPTVNQKSIVANLNVDIIHAILPMKAVDVLGLEESDLGDAARRVAAAQNIPIHLDSERIANNAFTCCSDQANFIFHGIPSIILKIGFTGESDAVFQKWRRERYHTPSDDLHQPIDLQAAATFEEIMFRLLLDVADDSHRPQWKSNSFYKRYAAM